MDIDLMCRSKKAGLEATILTSCVVWDKLISPEWRHRTARASPTLATLIVYRWWLPGIKLDELLSFVWTMWHNVPQTPYFWPVSFSSLQPFVEHTQLMTKGLWYFIHYTTVGHHPLYKGYLRYTAL
jgi:hypothetical protein